MAETYYLKSLRLVTPLLANSLGIPAEAPTFLSSQIDAPQRCLVCSTTFTPLVYQTGQVTVAQHFHADRGGIYFYATPSPLVVAALAGQYGFIASLEPIGQVHISHTITGERCGRAEAVRTSQITAYCAPRPTAIPDPLSHPRRRPPQLHEGILLEHPPRSFSWRRRYGNCGNPGDLLPLCADHRLHRHEHAAFRFAVRDGTIFFTQRPLP